MCNCGRKLQMVLQKTFSFFSQAQVQDTYLTGNKSFLILVFVFTINASHSLLL